MFQWNNFFWLEIDFHRLIPHIVSVQLAHVKISMGNCHQARSKRQSLIAVFAQPDQYSKEWLHFQLDFLVSFASLKRAIACRLTIKVNKWQPNETNNWRINHCIEQWNLCAFIANHAIRIELNRVEYEYHRVDCRESKYILTKACLFTTAHTVNVDNWSPAKSHTHRDTFDSFTLKKIAYCFFFFLKLNIKRKNLAIKG